MFVNFFYPNGNLLCCQEVVAQFSETTKNIIGVTEKEETSESSMFVTIGNKGEITEEKIRFNCRNLFATLEKLNVMERGAVA